MKDKGLVRWFKEGHNAMIAGCVALAGALLLFTDTSIGSALFLMLCPLMHLLMMKGMGMRCHQQNETEVQSTNDGTQTSSTPAGSVTHKEF